MHEHITIDFAYWLSLKF